MVIALNVWVALFICGFVIGMFMVMLFILFRKRYATHIQNITCVLFILSLMLLSEIAEESDLVDSYPSLIGSTITADLLIWPFMVFYIQFILGKRNQYHWRDVLYFIPFLIGFFWQLPFLLLPGELKLSYYDNGIPTDVAWFVGFKLFFSILFLIHLLKAISQGIKQFQSFIRGNKRLRFLKKIKHIISILAISVLCIYLLFFNNYFSLLPIGDSDQIGSLFISCIFLLFGMIVFKNPQSFQADKYSPSVKRFFKGTESQYLEQLLHSFENSKLYLNEKLAIKDVAIALKLSTQQLSYLLNRQLGISFPDFVNAYRVKEVQHKIRQGEHQQKTLLGIALESGFNGKASFNRIFKEHTGLTPSEFAKKQEKEVSNTN